MELQGYYKALPTKQDLGHEALGRMGLGFWGSGFADSGLGRFRGASSQSLLSWYIVVPQQSLQLFFS